MRKGDLRGAELETSFPPLAAYPRLPRRPQGEAPENSKKSDSVGAVLYANGYTAELAFYAHLCVSAASHGLGRTARGQLAAHVASVVRSLGPGAMGALQSTIPYINPFSDTFLAALLIIVTAFLSQTLLLALYALIVNHMKVLNIFFGTVIGGDLSVPHILL